jgi:hypothetical protein
MQIHNREIDDDELVRLWHSEERVGPIAIRLGLDASHLIAAWRRLKEGGILPRGERPMGRTSRPDDIYDGRPKVGLYGRDPLYDALARGKR